MKDKFFNESSFDASPLGPIEDSGVYAICVMRKYGETKPRVVYIGSSKNIYRRVLNTNHIFRRLINLTDHLVSVYCCPCDNYLEVEAELIRKYQPRFNIQHKNTK